MHLRINFVKRFVTSQSESRRRQINSSAIVSMALAKKILEILKTDYTDDTLSLTTIAQKLNMNASYLSRVFKQETGNSFIDVLNCLRLDEARRLLHTTAMPVQEVAERVGYTSASYFIKVFKKHCGKTPNQFRTDAESH